MLSRLTAFQRVRVLIALLLVFAAALQIGHVYTSSLAHKYQERLAQLHQVAAITHGYVFEILADVRYGTPEYLDSVGPLMQHLLDAAKLPPGRIATGYYCMMLDRVMAIRPFSPELLRQYPKDLEFFKVYQTAAILAGKSKTSASWANSIIWVAYPVVYRDEVIGHTWANSPTDDLYLAAISVTLRSATASLALLAVALILVNRFIKQLQEEVKSFAEAVVAGRGELSATAVPELVPLYESVKRARAEVEKFFALGSDAMCVISLGTGKLINVNNAWLGTLGYSREEVVNHSVFEFVHPDDIARAEHVGLCVAFGGEVEHFDNHFRCKDGTYKTISWSAVPDESGLVVYAVGRDMTGYRIDEEEMIRLDRLSLAAQLATSISHEIRNPMTTIRGFLQLLGNKYTTTSDGKYFALMMEELDRANGIISEYLSLAKNRPRQMKPTNLVDVIRCVLPLIRADSLLTDKNIATELLGVPDILADERALRQLLLNLVRNGLEAMEANQTLTIRVYPQDDYAVLQIIDEGTGIPDHVLKKLGTPFLTTKENGTGLGLSVCYRIIDEHNASVSVESSPEGTAFTICFPSHQPETPELVTHKTQNTEHKYGDYVGLGTAVPRQLPRTVARGRAQPSWLRRGTGTWAGMPSRCW